jgi:hypothetical protein
LDGSAAAEVVFYRDGAEAVARRDGEELRFAPAEHGWRTSGDPGLLDQPDALERSWCALANPNAGELIVSPPAGVELTDLAGRSHLGGGSHGSLDAGDSEVPMLTVGIEAPVPRRIVDLKQPRWRTSASGRATPPMPPDDRDPAHLDRARERMVGRQRARGIEDEEVLRAMGRVPRELFVPEAERRRAYGDAALPIGHGQTISQPYMVAVIVEALTVQPGLRVLDVGAGSGYQAASWRSSEPRWWRSSGSRSSPSRRARETSRRPASRVEVVVGDGTLGWPERAPYDGSRWRLPRRLSRRRSTSSCVPAGGWSCRSGGRGPSGWR